MKSALKFGMLALMVAAVALTGCKKKPKAGAGVGDIDGVGGVMGTDLYGEGLGARPDSLTDVASQFVMVYFVN